MIDVNTCFTYAYSAGTYADFFQAITTDAASTNYLDLDAAGIRIAGGSKPPWIIMRVGTAENGTATSLEIRLQTDSDSGFSTTLRDIKMWRFLSGQMTAGKLLINEPLGHWKYQRYMRLYFNAFNTCGALTVVSYLGSGPESAETDIDLVQAGS